MINRTAPAARNYRNLHTAAYEIQHVKVETAAYSVGVDGIQAYFAGSALLYLLYPVAEVEIHVDSAAVYEYIIAALAVSLGVYADNNALAAEYLSGVADELRILDRLRIDRNLVGSRAERIAEILHRTDAASDAQRHEHLLRSALYHVEHNAPALVGSRYIVEYKLVRALTVVFDRKLHRVAYVPYALEIHALYDLAVADVKAWDYPFS